MPTNPLDEQPPVHQLRMLVSGRVQGVGYRMWARGEAERLGISGTIRNLPDATVEVLARGTAAQLDRFHEILARGPVGAEVDAVQRQPAEHIPTASFTIIG